MKPAATRWRLLELRRQHRAIETGIDLLDRKREGLLRALVLHRQAAADSRRRLTDLLAHARPALDLARVTIGDAAALSATLAQPSAAAVTACDEAIVGVHVTRLSAACAPFRANYGPGGTCSALDEAGARFAAVLPEIITVAGQEHAERTLKKGLQRTTRTLNALRAVLLPALDADIRAVTSSLEEEEREEAIRWRSRRP